MSMYDLEVKISADSSQLQKSFKDTEKSTEKVGDKVRELDKTLSDDTAAGAFSEAVDEAAVKATSALDSVTRAANTAAAAVADTADISGRKSSSGAFPASKAVADTAAEQAAAVEELNDALSKTDELLDDIDDSVDDMLPEAEKDIGDTKDEVEDMNKSLSETSEEADKADRSIRKIAGAAAAIAITRKAAQELLGCFQAYSDYEGAVIRVNDIFKGSAESVENFAERNARALGMSRSAAYQYASVYGNLFRNITADTEENSRVTIAMLNASAVVASKTGRTVSDVMERIRSGLLGNTEAIEDLGIFVNVAMIQTTDAFKKMADGRSWEQLNYQEQQQVRTLAILEQAHKQFGNEVSQNTAMSISTYQASVEDLKVSLGGLASGVLTPVIQILTYFTRSLSGCVAWFGSLNGTSQRYLKVALFLAGAIPAVALATKGLALAQAGLQAVQAILIPQTLTYATALKALLGWVALAAVAFGLLHNIFGSKKETDSAANTMDNYSDALAEAQKNANKAASSIGDVSKATKQLGDDVKRTLAGFDELNTLSDQNGSNSILSVDTDSLAEAADLAGSFSDMDYDIDFDSNIGSVSGNIKRALKNLWRDLKIDYGNWKDWWHGLGEDMYTGIEEGDWEPLLTRLNEKVEDLFGSKWTGFWQKAGSNMHEGIKNGNWTPLLEQFDDIVRRVFGDGWSDFWSGVGSNMHKGIKNGNWTPLLEDAEKGVRALFGDDWTNWWETVGKNMHKGIADGDWYPLLSQLDDKVRQLFGDGWTDFWEGVGGKTYNIMEKWSGRIKSLYSSTIKQITDAAYDGGAAWYDALNPDQRNFSEKVLDMTQKGKMIQNMGDTVQSYIQEKGYLGALTSGSFDQVRNAYSKYFSADDIDQIIENAVTDYLDKSGTVADLIAYQKYGLEAPAGSGAVSKLATALGKLTGHAKGGIMVAKPVVTSSGDLFGEDGREAILPLDNNTEWIDSLAARLAALIPTGSSTPIILDGREVGRFCLRAVENDKLRKGG